MKKALVVIDVQNGIVNIPVHDREGVLARIRKLQDRFRESGVPVIHVQHDGPSGDSLEEGTQGWRIASEVSPRDLEKVVHKRACDAFFQTELAAELKRLGIQDLVIAGCMTQYCVDTTCRRAVSLGYNVILAADSHSTSDEGGLTGAQIIAHHNTLLNGFSAGECSVTVTPSNSISIDDPRLY